MAEFHTVKDFLTRDVRRRFRERGVSDQRLTNWANRFGTIPARQLALVEEVCAEIGVEVPRHLINLERLP